MTAVDAERARLHQLALEARPHLRLASRGWLDRLETQRTEIEDAISSCIAADDARGAEMAAAVWRLWWLSGHLDEGRELLARVLDSGAAESPEVRADLLRGLGTIVFSQGDTDEAERVNGQAARADKRLRPDP